MESLPFCVSAPFQAPSRLLVSLFWPFCPEGPSVFSPWLYQPQGLFTVSGNSFLQSRLRGCVCFCPGCSESKGFLEWTFWIPGLVHTGNGNKTSWENSLCGQSLEL